MNRFLAFIIPLCLLIPDIAAQQFRQFEFWLDGDIERRISSSFSGNTFSTELDMSECPDGFHVMTFRVSDGEDEWSSPVSRYFLKFAPADGPASGNPEYYEYWIDNYASKVNGRGFNGNRFIADIDLSELSSGFHVFNFRAADSFGNWSSPVSRYFLKFTTDLGPVCGDPEYYEYWIDNYSSKVRGKGFDGNQFVADIDMSALAPGFHIFNFRAGDAAGNWSSPVSRYFLKPSSMHYGETGIAAYQYWFNDGKAVTTVALEQPCDPFTLETLLPVTNSYRKVTPENLVMMQNVSDGRRIGTLNTFSIRFKDLNGCWSPLHTDTIAIPVSDNPIDFTGFIVNPDADRQFTGWSTSSNRSIKNTGHWSGEQRNYFSYSIQKGQTAEMTQEISGLPAGTYRLGAYTRGMTGMSIGLGIAVADSIFKPDSDGWQSIEMEFVTDGSPVVVHARATNNTEKQQQWDISNFTLLMSQTLAQVSEDEWQRIIRLKGELEDCGWECPWDIGNSPEAAYSFQGLTLENGRVTQINLAGLGLSGVLPKSLFSFPGLILLNVADNDLTFDIGAELPRMINEGEVNVPELMYLNLSNNRLTGNLAPVGDINKNLRTLDVSGNKLTEVSPALPASISALHIDRQNIDRVVDIDLSDITEEKFTSSMPSIIFYDHESGDYRKALRFIATESDDKSYNLKNSEEWGLLFDYIRGKLSVTDISAQNVFSGENGSRLNMLLSSDGVRGNGTDMKINLWFASGDANFTGNVDITDLQSSILYILGKYKGKAFNHTAVDLIPDSCINVQDIVSLVNILLNQNQDKAGAKKVSSEKEAETEEYEACVFCKDGQLILDSTSPIAAFDIYVNNTSEFRASEVLSTRYFIHTAKVTGDTLHLVGYTLSGDAVPAGEVSLGTLNGDAMVVRADLSDPEANLVKATTSYIPSGNERTEESTSISIEYAEGKLYIGNNDLSELRWQVCTTDGCLIASGIIEGLNAPIPIEFGVGTDVVIVSAVNDHSGLTKKIIIK